MRLLPVGRGRRTIIVLLLLGLGAVGALARWAAAWWRGPSAGAGGSAYSLLATWDGANLPSGKFERPIGIAVAAGGDVYVTDSRARVVHLSATGELKGEWGREGSGAGEFSIPVGVSVAPDGSIFVSDYVQDRIQKFSPAGRFLLGFGTSGSAPGQLQAPAGLAVDGRGSVYVADFYNHRIERFHSDGSFQSVIGHPGRVGRGALHYPTGVTVTPDGRVMVADAYNYQLQWFSPDGDALDQRGYRLLRLWPRPTSSTRGFNAPTAAAVGPSGVIHVADSGNHRLVMLSREGRYLGEWTVPDANPNVYSPEHVAVSPDGSTVYATDLASNRVLVLAAARGRTGGSRFPR